MTKGKIKTEPKTIIIDAEPMPQQQLPAVASDKMLSIIEKASTDPRCNVEKMRAMLDMKMELVRDERRIAYNASMKKAQEDMKPIVRAAQSEKGKYAKLEHIDNAIRPIYSANGFSLSFDSKKEEDGTITAICDILHDSGHFEKKSLNAARDLAGPKGGANKTDIQAVGSTISYLRRYLTCMVFNITLIGEDDDGKGGKLPPKPQDKFSEKAQEQSGNKPPEEKPQDPNAKIILAAHQLRDKMIAESALEKRGKILMNNMKIMKALDEANLDVVAKEIRALAEIEVSNGVQ